MGDWSAAIEQAKAGLKDMAALLKSYYDSLIDSGFNSTQALALTIAFQGQMMTSAAASGEKEDES